MNAGRLDTHSAGTDFGGLHMNTHRTGNRMLLAASAALLAGVALHGVDHALQERGIGALNTEVLVGGGVNAALAVTAFVLSLRTGARSAIPTRTSTSASCPGRLRSPRSAPRPCSPRWEPRCCASGGW